MIDDANKDELIESLAQSIVDKLLNKVSLSEVKDFAFLESSVISGTFDSIPLEKFEGTLIKNYGGFDIDDPPHMMNKISNIDTAKFDLNSFLNNFKSLSAFTENFNDINIIRKQTDDMSNHQWIIVGNTTTVEASAVIPFSMTANGDYYIPINISEEVQSKMYINNNSSIPSGKIYYDYFGSGELYVNMPEEVSLLNGKEFFQSLMRVYFLGETGILKSLIPTECRKYESYAEACISPLHQSDPPMYGWLFDLEQCFNIHKGDTPSTHAYPICEWYSLVTDDKKIVSPHYKFANHIPSFSSCSCEKRVGTANTVYYCDTDISRQPSCRFYSPLSETVTKVSITPNNSSKSSEFEMVHFSTLDDKNVFKITNLTDNVLINQLEVPSEVPFADALKEANSVFDEYVSCYTDHNFEDVKEVQSETSKQSFIQTLLEV